MYREQVEIALAITAIVRRLFPNVRVTWGGAHVTAMRDEIAGDAQYGVSIDGFVFGYAEQTWVDILNAVGSGSSLPSELVRAGGGQARFAREDLRIVPDFGPVDLFERSRLTFLCRHREGAATGHARTARIQK